jgi:hypothetical protein
LPQVSAIWKTGVEFARGKKHIKRQEQKTKIMLGFLTPHAAVSQGEEASLDI